MINVIRAHLAEFGIVAPVGRKGVEELLNVVTDASDKRLPVVARICLAALGVQLRRLKEQILEFDRMIVAWQAGALAVIRYARPWPSWPRPSAPSCWRVRWRQPWSAAAPTMP